MLSNGFKSVQNCFKLVQMWLKSFFGSFLVLFVLAILVFFSPDLRRFFGPQKSTEETNVSNLIDSLINAPEIHLNYQDSYSTTQKNCLYHTCFDVYKCGGLHKKILVHISKPLLLLAGKTKFYYNSYDIFASLSSSSF